MEPGMLFTQFVIVESFITSLTDLFPKLLRAPGRHKIFVLIICAFSFLVHLTLVTQVSLVWHQFILNFVEV